MLQLNARGPYASKDQRKADSANKFVGIGAWGSSTYAYAQSVDPRYVNCGYYDADDRVFVSVNGARKVRVSLDAIIPELRLVVQAGATILADGDADRLRAYNIGERELAVFLRSQGYVRWGHPDGYSEWRPE